MPAEISLHSAAGELEQPAGDKREVDEGRQHRLLNVFNIVRFPNEGCNTTGSQYGVCYTATECEALGGTAAGTCASGFGVCCAFRHANSQMFLSLTIRATLLCIMKITRCFVSGLRASLQRDVRRLHLSEQHLLCE